MKTQPKKRREKISKKEAQLWFNTGNCYSELYDDERVEIFEELWKNDQKK